MTDSLLPRSQAPTGVSNEQLRFLGCAYELEESGPPGVASAVILSVAALLAASITWAALTPVHQTAVAPGQVVPNDAIAAVQHLEGGIVAKVLVQDGVIVEAGQPILELQSASALPELKALRARESALSAQQARLTAFVQGGGLRGSLAGDGHSADLVGVQTSILHAQRQSKEQQRNVLERQLAAKQSDRTTLQERIALARRQATLAVQEREARRELFEKGLTTRAAYIEAQRADNRAQGEVVALEGQLQRTAEAIQESEARLRELEARLTSDAELEIGQVSSELLQVRESLSKLEDRVERLTVRAPAGGRVKDLKASTPGTVVAPGMIIAEIVPPDQRLRVQARISPRDIGHVRLGQPVAIKVDSFAFSTYGAISGHVEQIAASTTADADGGLYYKGLIELDRTFAGTDPGLHPLKSGMTVQAELVISERSVLQHLIAPVHTALAGALRER